MKQIREASNYLHLEGAVVFAIPETPPSDPTDLSQWWSWTPGASWRAPTGPGSHLEGLEDHPVVNVTYEDAAAYAQWAGKRLPTEAEWEKAARGGLDRKLYTWGDELFHEGNNSWMANIWQGEWPLTNTMADGFLTSSPVKSYPPNGFGLYDMSGNVWEIVSDRYHPSAYTFPSATEPNSRGPSQEEWERAEFPAIYRVTKGGSFLCSETWCKGYQPGSREGIEDLSPTNHTGFRCVMDAISQKAP